MNIRITACSDAHIGKSFSSYPPHLAKVLAVARLQSLEKVLHEANTRNSQLLLLAGDLFDSVWVDQDTLASTLRILATFRGAAILLVPGNHDHSDTEKSELWARVRQCNVAHLHVFEKPGRYELSSRIGLPVVIYALPCTDAQGSESLVSQLLPQKEDRNLLRIGLGHGTVVGLTPDTYGKYFPKHIDELQQLQAHFWVIGHAHVPRPRKEDPNWLFFPGSCEADGFDHLHAGSAWFLEASPQGLNSTTLLDVGILRFHERLLHCTGKDDIELDLADMHPARTLLRLQLQGFASEPLEDALSRMKEDLIEQFLFAEIDDSKLRPAFKASDLQEFPERSFPFLLLSQLYKKKKFEALHLAYALIEEHRHR